MHKVREPSSTSASPGHVPARLSSAGQPHLASARQRPRFPLTPSSQSISPKPSSPSTSSRPPCPPPEAPAGSMRRGELLPGLRGSCIFCCLPLGRQLSLPRHPPPGQAWLGSHSAARSRPQTPASGGPAFLPTSPPSATPSLTDILAKYDRNEKRITCSD